MPNFLNLNTADNPFLQVKYFLVLCLSLNCLSAKSQTYRAFIKAGENAYIQGEFYDAYQHFKTAMSIDSSKSELWYQYAKSAAAYHLYAEANYYFQKIEATGLSGGFQDFGENWLNTLLVLEAYETAKNVQQKYRINSRRIDVSAAQKLRNHPIEVNIQHLPEPVNTRFSDFAAQSVNGALYYTSMRFKRKNQFNQEEYYAKLVVSENNDRGTPLRFRFNKDEESTANAFFSKDGTTIYFTRCQLVEQRQQCAIYTRKKEGEKWGKIEKLPTKINAEGCTATQPCLGFDSLDNKMYLYFASDKGAKGQLSIWRAEQLKGNNYGVPQKILYTTRKEVEYITPFFDEKTQTLYFSSNQNGGMGGFDIYFQKRKKEGWTKAENIGYPLNSSYDDAYFRLDSSSKKGYFSSNRLGSLSLTKGSCCYDIYAFSFLKETPEQPETPIITTVPPPIVDTPSIVLSPPDPLKNLKDFLPLALYFHNDEPNPRTRLTKTKISYQQAFEQYYQLKQTYIDTYAQPLTGVGKQQAESNVAVFFEDEVKGNFERLDTFSSLLLEHLKQGKKIEIILKGFASPLAKTDYNERLAQRRISCIRNYFDNYQRGIFKTFIAKGQLNLSEAPFGESKAASSVSDIASDQRNSIYSVEAAKERRVEIVEVK